MTMPRDFFDGISPMLVKELRQGMRSKALIISLFLLQGLLIFNAIVGLVSTSDGDLSGTTAGFWTILGLPLLMILPLSALGGIGNEIKANTLDLVFLTRLTATRIVLGKWIAVVVQSVLLALTVLPFIALRYYLGGINVTADLSAAGLMLVGSALLSAFTVALSSYPAKIVRFFIILGFVFSLQMIGPLFMFGGGRFGLIGIWSDWSSVAAVVVVVPLFVLLMIEVGAMRIAPVAENHAGLTRLLALLVLLVTGTAGLLSARAAWMIVAGQVFVTPFCIAALCERPPTVPGVFRSLVRRGGVGNLLSRIFTPGWHTGFLYVLLVWMLIGFFWQRAGWLDSGPRGDALKQQLSLAGFGVSLLLPAVIAPSLSRKRFLYILSFVLLSLAVFSVTSAFVQNSGHKEELINLTAFLPPLAVFGPVFSNLHAAPPLIFMACLGVLVLAVYFFKSRPVWRQSAKLRQLARQEPHHVA